MRPAALQKSAGLKFFLCYTDYPRLIGERTDEEENAIDNHICVDYYIDYVRLKRRAGRFLILLCFFMFL